MIILIVQSILTCQVFDMGIRNRTFTSRHSMTKMCQWDIPLFFEAAQLKIVKEEGRIENTYERPLNVYRRVLLRLERKFCARTQNFLLIAGKKSKIFAT